MNDRIRRAVWWLLAAGISWQAILGAGRLGGAVWQSRSVGIGPRFGESTDDRLARELGQDSEVARALRDVAQAGEWVLCRLEFTPAALDERTGRIARLTRLRHALFPTPLVTNAGPEPVAAAEAALATGQSVLLLVLGDELAPEGRSGWTCVQRQSGFQIWRLRRP